MKDYKSVLVTAVEVVTFLVSAFGGFLKRIAPPDQPGVSYPLGVISFLVLIILLILSAISRNYTRRASPRKWLLAGIGCFLLAIPASLIYPHALGRYTYPSDAPLSARKINASDAYLTEQARQFVSIAPNDAIPERLSHNFPADEIWRKEGIERAELILNTTYAFLVLSLASAIFCLLEANLSVTKT